MSMKRRLKRLRWLCTHRAQLEMDVLLGNFLDKQFSKLSPEQEAAFIALAEQITSCGLWSMETRVPGSRAGRSIEHDS